jgi:hypothetical protein
LKVTGAKFLTDLDAHLKDDDVIWVLDSPLIYESDIVGRIEVPADFETDLVSVPRVPFLYYFWGDRAHREGVVHDYLYRIDSAPVAERPVADAVFREAMGVRGKSLMVRWPMFFGVRLGGWTAYHKKKVRDKL